MNDPLADTLLNSASQSTRLRRRVVIAVQLVAVLIAAYAVFRIGALWSLRGFAQAQPVPGPNPFVASFPRYLVAVLWPIPGAVLLFFSAGGFGRRTPRWRILLVAAGLWFLAYLLIRPAQVYYYWLMPT